MATPTFPFLNPQVKCGFRWFNNPDLLARKTKQCKDNGVEQPCPFAIWSPMDRLPPFQFLAVTANQAGLGQPVKWGIYYINDPLDATPVVDLDADIPLLELNTFLDSRTYVTYFGNVLSTPIPGSENGQVYESRIELESGSVLYSEAFKVNCLKYAYLTPELSYGDWGGQVQGVFASNSQLPLSPGTGDKFLVTGDAMVYTFNGVGYDSVPATNGEYYNAGYGQPFYSRVGGVWQIGPSPVTYDPQTGQTCWTGLADVPLVLSYPHLEGTQDARITMTFNKTSPFGAFNLDDNEGNLTIFGGQTQTTYEGTIEVDASTVITLNPTTDSAAGCIISYALEAISDPIDCFWQMRWTNCGNVGTQYYGSGFINRLYIDPKSSFLYRPQPNITLDTNEGSEGDQSVSSARKEVTYQVGYGTAPWWLVDALTEIPLHDTVQLFTTGLDTLSDVDVQAEWTSDCLASVTVAFTAADSVFTSACCDTWDPQCLVPCQEVLGLTTDASATGYYVVPNAAQVRYYEEGNFGQPEPCSLVDGIGSYPDSYFNGSEWVPVSEFMFYNTTPTSVTIAGVVMTMYSVMLEYSLNGTDWISTNKSATQATLEGGWGVAGLPENTGLLRLRVFVGMNCTIGYSPSVGCSDPQLANITLSGAGYADVDGTWTVGDQVLGRNTYTATVQGGAASISWDGTAWVLFALTLSGPSGPGYYIVYRSTDDTLYPWQGTWEVALEGFDPAPVVTCG